ncbi:uncharacterized protein LOC108098088 [Drosophila ficusphila]|uniref:uncharacterized protein LOC108098088 n=1 Tax=Drosophila ficusphila TaxID=30025 RepID=UPI0007E7AB7D|nr:uncharacterized protein LOC108098088 [Drosophila ficusphila]
MAMERRRPRGSSPHFLRAQSSHPSPSSPPRTPHQQNGTRAATITSLLSGRLNRVARLAPRGLRFTEDPVEGAPFAPERESQESAGTVEVNPGVMVVPEAASPRGSAIHGPPGSLTFAGPRDSESPRISAEVPDAFNIAAARTSSLAGAQGNLRFGPTTGGGSDDSTTAPTTAAINFAEDPVAFERNRFSSELEGEYDDNGNNDRMESSPDIGTCHGGWSQRQQQPAAGGHAGRDTLGFAIHLGTATLGHTRCSLGTACGDDCGYGTGCDAGCRDAHGVDESSFMIPGTLGQPGILMASGGNASQRGVPMGASGGYPSAAAGYKPMGPGPAQRSSQDTDFGSDQLNYFVTFLLEVLGVLVFFAICTITFWITLGYHVVQLLVDLKNADRNVQVAVAIVFGLLFIAFAISQVTNRTGSCCHARDRARSRHKGHGFWPFRCSSKSKPKAKSNSCARKWSSAPKTKSDGGGCRRKSICGAKLESRKPRFTDCEGRAIFLSSRRYAIPTEMKQPPTIVLWLRDVVARMLR